VGTSKIILDMIRQSEAQAAVAHRSAPHQSVGGLHCLTHSSLLISQQKSRCYIKFVKWLVRKNRALSMSKNDDELNKFIDEVTDGAHILSCVEVIFKLVKQVQPWGDERIKKIVAALAVEGIKICIATDIWHSYSYVCAYFLQYTF
jgi:hypothetical protein